MHVMGGLRKKLKKERLLKKILEVPSSNVSQRLV